jgi:ribosomal protein S18 acetylase RimI-like enzyme
MMVLGMNAHHRWETFDVRLEREAIPAAMAGRHRVACVELPERFAAYVAGAGTLLRAAGDMRGRFDYYGTAPDLIGFLDLYRDAANETLHVGYINVRPDFRRRGIAWTLVDAALRAYPATSAFDWGLMMHPAVECMYVRQYREGRMRIAGSRHPLPRVRLRLAP